MAENNTHTLVGHNYTTPDIVAKVTVKAKYAEDFRVEGMLFAKLLLSPMPHARVVRIDPSVRHTTASRCCAAGAALLHDASTKATPMHKGTSNRVITTERVDCTSSGWAKLSTMARFMSKYRPGD